ncbi:DUF4184 family protein [Herbiconiux sp. KACC 21604]|uniref:DUF4184 family protein n=1 Tax=unclassified Herbiconiux TaxID=2618217 RepID=UPI00149140DB|nr:DUF4184 family protein [Herbiconiux sp. SALV-R1]QJU52979.1 DUF4184 family protein [Herbiconiux sp. SALV-R1]WPO87908.1 DUF4184 family protein [Herbiconiux sp. KACC 21604]
MPFTISHAVAALPFVRTPLPAGAVAIGAMTPDLPLFVSAGHGYGVTHGWPGLLLVDLPVALAIFALWRIVARPVLPGVLPRALGERLPPGWAGSPADGARTLWRDRGRSAAATIGGAVLAAVIGILTHIVWDAFTHTGRLGAALPVLDAPVAGVPVAAWLQYASSALGLAGLVGYALWWFLRHPRTPGAGAGPRSGRAHPLVLAAFWTTTAALLAIMLVTTARIVL